MATETDTITLNIEPFLTPFAMVLSSIILAAGFIVGMNSLSGKLTTNTTATTNTGTDTTTTTTGTNAVSLSTIKNLFQSDFIKFGNPDSKVLLVEVSDPSCPYCHIAAGKNPELNKSAGTQFTLVSDGGSYVAPVEEMKKLVDAGQAAYVWIYTNGHGNGELATQALYCASELGKFWEVHDLLYSSAGYDLINNVVKNDKTKSGDLANFVKDVVSYDSLKSCLDNGKYASRISSDKATASSLGVTGTPGFFVNDTNFPGAYSWTDMKSVVDAALN